MKRVIALQYSSGRLMGVSFKPERRGGVYVGVAVVDAATAEKFEDRDDFEVEDVEASEVNSFPADFPLLAPQKAALVKAGIDDLDKLAAHDFTAQKVAGISAKAQATIDAYLTAKGLRRAAPQS